MASNSKRTRTPKPIAPHPFDAAYGTDTDGLIPGRRLGIGHRQDKHITAYHGTAPSVFHQLVEMWRQTPPHRPPHDYTFLDLGAGKGRAMLLASEMEFRQVIGVELNPDLVAVAENNIEIWRKQGRARAPIALLEGDIAALDFPDTPCLVYLFNPFGPVVLRQLIRRIEKRFGAQLKMLDVLYVNHEHQDVFQRHPGFEELWSGSVWLSAEDAAADVATIERDAKGEYATTGDEVCSIYRWTANPAQKD
ncbi:MAG: class I SAM-dependent methyltransferase [Acidobacteriaceae bacterium]